MDQTTGENDLPNNLSSSGSNNTAGTVRAPLRAIAGGLLPHSKQSQQRAQMRRLTALLNTTAALFAHEVANPLQGISASLELVEKDLERHPFNSLVVTTRLERVRQEVARLCQLLHEFRSLSVPQSLTIKSDDLRKVVKEALAIQLIVYRAAGITVKYEFADPLPAVNLDAAKIKQVILNLCKNSLDAMPGGGDLILRCYSLGATVVLEIADSGGGIPEGLDAFALFKTTKAGGSGLGLPIVEQIVLDHNGTVDYISDPGRGTTFKVVFPAAV